MVLYGLLEFKPVIISIMTSRARITAVMEGLVYVSMLDKRTG